MNDGTTVLDDAELEQKEKLMQFAKDTVIKGSPHRGRDLNRLAGILMAQPSPQFDDLLVDKEPQTAKYYRRQITKTVDWGA